MLTTYSIIPQRYIERTKVHKAVLTPIKLIEAYPNKVETLLSDVKYFCLSNFNYLSLNSFRFRQTGTTIRFYRR